MELKKPSSWLDSCLQEPMLEGVDVYEAVWIHLDEGNVHLPKQVMEEAK